MTDARWQQTPTFAHRGLARPNVDYATAYAVDRQEGGSCPDAAARAPRAERRPSLRSPRGKDLAERHARARLRSTSIAASSDAARPVGLRQDHAST
jgi:hypothetical protein